MPDSSAIPYRVSMTTACFMVGINALADAAQVLLTLSGVFIPLDDLVTFVMGAINFMWFLLLGVNLFGGKKATTKVVSALATSAIELVPVVDALPTLTMGVISIIRASRAEDRLAFEESQAQAAALQAQAANENYAAYTERAA